MADTESEEEAERNIFRNLFSADVENVQNAWQSAQEDSDSVNDLDMDDIIDPPIRGNESADIPWKGCIMKIML